MKKSLSALLAMVVFTMMLSQVAFATDFTMDKEVPMEERVSKQEYYNALKKEYEKYNIGFEMEQYDPTIDSDFVCTRDELEEAVEDARAFAEGIKIIEVDPKFQIEEMECNNGVLRTMPVTFAYNKTLVVASDDEVRVPGAIEYEISIVGDLDVQSNMVMYIDYARIRGRNGANVAEEDAWIEYSYGDNDRVSYDCGGTVKFEFRDKFGFVQFTEVDFMHGENFEASDWTADHWSE